MIRIRFYIFSISLRFLIGKKILINWIYIYSHRYYKKKKKQIFDGWIFDDEKRITDEESFWHFLCLGIKIKKQM